MDRNNSLYHNPPSETSMVRYVSLVLDGIQERILTFSVLIGLHSGLSLASVPRP